jgi:hypothetical protein
VKFATLTIVCLITLSAAPHLDAQKIYTWTDENGLTHITDQPPPDQARVQDVIKYKEKTPQEQAAIEREMESLRRSNERQDNIDAAQRAKAAAREAEKQAQEAVDKARKEAQENQEYVRRLSNRSWKRRQFRKRIERIKVETEATQAEAAAEVQRAEEAAQKARQAAAAANKTQ